jgi:ElaB/YqjD/DUF883 family membrane-anchored ribosome-binding protein
MSHATTDKLLDDLRAVIRDSEELLKATAGQAGEHISQARSCAEASLKSAKARVAEMSDDAAERVRNAALDTNAYVKSNAWVAIGASALAGLLAGILLARRQGGPR